MLPWPKLGVQPDEPDELNEPDDEHTVEVELPDGTTVWCTPEAADQWNPRLWR